MSAHFTCRAYDAFDVFSIYRISREMLVFCRVLFTRSVMFFDTITFKVFHRLSILRVHMSYAPSTVLKTTRELTVTFYDGRRWDQWDLFAFTVFLQCYCSGLCVIQGVPTAFVCLLTCRHRRRPSARPSPDARRTERVLLDKPSRVRYNLLLVSRVARYSRA